MSKGFITILIVIILNVLRYRYKLYKDKKNISTKI